MSQDKNCFFFFDFLTITYFLRAGSEEAVRMINLVCFKKGKLAKTKIVVTFWLNQEPLLAGSEEARTSEINLVCFKKGKLGTGDFFAIADVGITHSLWQTVEI